MKLTRPEQTDEVLSDLIKHIKKDPDMPGLSSSEQKELWNRIVQQNKYQDRYYLRWLVWSGSVAASICLILLAGWYMRSSRQPATLDYVSVMQTFETVDKTSDNVQLLLANNQTITIQGQEVQLDYQENGYVAINKNEKREIKEDTKDAKAAFNQLIVPAGKRSMLTLEDGTRVWINSGSKLVYPVNFEQHKREIFVDGEIYLDVISNPERPFIVHTGALDVNVLGTQFNVYAYADQPDLHVVLVSGKVEIQKNSVSKEILKPNQLFTYNEDRQDSSVSTVDISDYIAWKDGYYPFHRQDLGTVLTKLSKYYDVQFKWNERIRELSCSGKLDLKENLQEVLSALEKTAPIEIRKISEREYTVIVKP